MIEHHIPRLKGLVCPHAGYEFSGQTPAIAYKLLAGSDAQTVVVMGPSHYALFRGACIPNADAYCQDRRIDDTEQPLTQALPFGRGEGEAAVQGPTAGLVARRPSQRRKKGKTHLRRVSIRSRCRCLSGSRC